MKIGYMRVSTIDQNTDLQRKALEGANCEQIFEDKMSGARQKRPGLTCALRVLKPGDSLVIWKLDRLGRSVKNLVTLITDMRQRDVHLISLTDNIDTNTAMGRFAFHIMCAFAEMERELNQERTRAGLAVARSAGRIGGRRPKVTEENFQQIGRLIRNGVDRKRLAIIYDISMPTIYKHFPASKFYPQSDAPPRHSLIPPRE